MNLPGSRLFHRHFLKPLHQNLYAGRGQRLFAGEFRGLKRADFRNQQADYLGVPVEGPYKPEHYRH
jgi:hypothetical protein